MIKKINTSGLTEKTYRLEFNINEQKFNLNNHIREEDTNGWFTIFEHCTDFEFLMFQAFVYRVPKKTLTKEYLLKEKFEIAGFMENLIKSELV